MTEELREKYARLLREGKTSEATQVAREARDYSEESSEDDDGEVDVEQGEPEKEEDEPMSEEDRFAELNGVGPELADELVEEFETFENFKDAKAKDLEPISGIGEVRAESLVSQVS